jgi:hypothetical protein
MNDDHEIMNTYIMASALLPRRDTKSSPSSSSIHHLRGGEIGYITSIDYELLHWE